jgi:hypothetical protein
MAVPNNKEDGSGDVRDMIADVVKQAAAPVHSVD